MNLHATLRRAIGTTTVVLLVTCVQQLAICQTKSTDDKSDRYAIVSNSKNMVMVDKINGRSWILVTRQNEKKWVPLARVDSVEAAKKWLASGTEADLFNGNGKTESGSGRNGNEKKQKPEDAFASWAADIVLNVEYGKDKNPGVKIWEKPPKISIFNANETQRKAVESAVKSINEALARTRFGKLEIGEDNDGDADMLVYVAPLRQFGEIASHHGFRIPQVNEGFFALQWDSNFKIHEAIVLLASDRLRDDSLKHITLEEIVQSLGPTNDSPTHKNSIFFSGRGGPTTLTERDKIVVEVLYSRLKAGNRKTAVQRAYRNHALKLIRAQQRKADSKKAESKKADSKKAKSGG